MEMAPNSTLPPKQNSVSFNLHFTNFEHLELHSLKVMANKTGSKITAFSHLNYK